MQIKRIFLATILLCSSLLAAQAAFTQNFYYVDAEKISPEFLSVPHQKDSPELTQQADEIIKLQTDITDAEIKEANEEAHFTPELVLRAMDKNYKKKDFPETHELLRKISDDCTKVASAAKTFWNTERPAQVNNKIRSLVGEPRNAAYPSGHTTCSRVVAEVMGQIIPSNREDFRQRAAEVAHNRIIAGMHWPQDITGGEQLALLFLGALQQSTAYQGDLKIAIKENQMN